MAFGWGIAEVEERRRQVVMLFRKSEIFTALNNAIYSPSYTGPAT